VIADMGLVVIKRDDPSFFSFYLEQGNNLKDPLEFLTAMMIQPCLRISNEAGKPLLQ
jgi:hypothetical protein